MDQADLANLFAAFGGGGASFSFGGGGGRGFSSGGSFHSHNFSGHGL